MATMHKYTSKEAIDIIKNSGIRDKSTKQLRELAVPLIRTAKARLKRLEEAGLADTPAYRGYKLSGAKISTATSDRNTLMREVHQAFNFLEMAKTSNVKDAKKYVAWLNEKLGIETTPEQREKIFDTFHRIEKDKTMALYLETYGYDKILEFAKNAAVSSNFNVEEAVESVREMLDDTELFYEEGTDLDTWTAIYGGNPFYK